MVRFNSDHLRKVVKDADPGNVAVAEAVDNIDFLTFSNLEESVKREVNYLQGHPLVLTGTTVTGWIYDVQTGGVSRIVFSRVTHDFLNLSFRSRELFEQLLRK